MGDLEPVVGRLVGDNTNYVRSLSDAEGRTKGFVDSAGGHFAALGGHITQMAKVAAVGLGGLVAGAAVFLKGAYEEGEQARRTLAQTNAVIASTGGVANVTGKDVDSLANRLSAMSGIDDELVANNENLLLTFTNVRNQVGKGNDVFNQASKAVLDMSVALGQDGKSSAIQLGKALNDPIKGITALQRVGVSFTAQQRDQITALVESGHTLEAQKIILKEINTEFGGSAAAAASPVARLQVAWKNLQEQVGTALMPTLATVAGFLADKLPGAFDTASRVISPVLSFIRKAIDDFRGGFENPDATFGPGIGKVEGFFLRLGASVRSSLDQAKAIIYDFKTAFTLALNGQDFDAETGPQRAAKAIAQAVEFVRDNAIPILVAVGAVIAVAVGPWIVLAGAVIYAYTHFVTFRDVVNEVVTTVVAVVSGFVDVVTTIWSQFGDQLITIAQGAWTYISGTVQGFMEEIRGIILVITSLIHGDWSGVWEGIKSILAGAWDVMVATVEGAFGVLRGAVSIGIEILLGIVGGIPGEILGALGGLGSLLYGAGRDIVHGLISGIGSMGGAVVDALLDLIPGPLKRFAGLLGIHSPSTVFEGFGRNIGQGLVAGMVAQEHPVAAAAGRLASAAAIGGAGVAGGTALAFAGGGGGRSTNVTLQIITPTGDIPDSTMRKIRSQLFGMGIDVPAGSIVPS